MTSQAHCSTATTAPPRPLNSVSSSVLTEATSVLRGFAQRIDAWLAARKRVSQDLDALAKMSDRELIDIGLDRASVNYIANGGRTRDYPF
jgi:uncharacterized protein YjiS (DUF1127 family)